MSNLSPNDSVTVYISHLVKMSDMQASVLETKNGFHVSGYEKIDYGFQFISGIFDIANPDLANQYKSWGRVL